MSNIYYRIPCKSVSTTSSETIATVTVTQILVQMLHETTSSFSSYEDRQ